MRVFDTHVHAGDPTWTASKILKNMDACGVEKMCLIAPHSMTGDWYERRRKLPPSQLNDEFRKMVAEEGDICNRWVAKIAKQSRGRILALARVDQISPDGPAMLKRAVEAGCHGLKLFMIGHYPEDERCFPTYEMAQDLGINILFHTGILGDGRNSRFHRPANLEILKNWPKVRALMAHVSWPWTDEAIATVGMCVHFDKNPRLVLDITPGAPLPWREDVISKALRYLPDEVIVFGSDNRHDSRYAVEVIDSYKQIFHKLGVPKDVQQRIFYDNVAKFWGVK